MARPGGGHDGERREEERLVTLLRCAFGRHMVEGEGEWRGVPDVLRSSFLLVVKELRRMSARLAALEVAAADKGEADNQRMEEKVVVSEEKDGRQEWMEETAAVLKRVEGVEKVSRQAMDRVEGVQHMLRQVNEATARREGECVVASLGTSHCCLEDADELVMTAWNPSAARWRRRVRRLQDEVESLVALVGASNQETRREIAPVATTRGATTSGSPGCGRQRDLLSWPSRGSEQQTVEDSVQDSPGAGTCGPARDAGQGNEVPEIEIVALPSELKSPVGNDHERTASKTTTISRRRAVDLRVETPSSTVPDKRSSQPDSHQHQEKKGLVVSKSDASASWTRETTAPISTSLPSSVRTLEAPASAEDFPPVVRSACTTSSSSTTAGQQRLDSLRARYAEARRKQQQSLTQLRSIGE